MSIPWQRFETALSQATAEPFWAAVATHDCLIFQLRIAL